MRRVSSRPRLVSFDDNFENVNVSLEEASESFDTALESIAFIDNDDDAAAAEDDEIIGRKRDRVQRHLEEKQHYISQLQETEPLFPPRSEPAPTSPMVMASQPQDKLVFKSMSSISNFSTISISEEDFAGDDQKKHSVENLPRDMLLHVASFLDAKSLRQWSSVSRSCRYLLREPFLWKSLCLDQHWKHMTTDNGDSIEKQLIDSLLLPVAAPCVASDEASPKSIPNLPLLLSMSASEYPTHICKAAFPNSISRRWPRWKSQLALSGDKSQVQYQGLVGTGDRCVRANAPLPKPLKRSNPQNAILQNAKSGNNDSNNSLLDYLCRGAQSAIGNLATSAGSVSNGEIVAKYYRPFVAPFLMPNGAINVTPRLISYFEVEICSSNDIMMEDVDEPEKDSLGEELQEPPTSAFPFRRHNAQDCVAIGLAMDRFSVQTRMPGWDAYSFGYHGDDGGTFHNSGGMIEEFGPSFGTGDVVGCGVDYVERGIFFTLNGRFLGYGWKNLQSDVLLANLYPVVGIDTNAIVKSNFGTSKPFMFDLQGMMDQHSSMIRSAYQFSLPPRSKSPSSLSGKKEGSIRAGRRRLSSR